MAMNGQNSMRTPSRGIGGLGLFLITLLTIFICSGVSWALTYTLAAPKSEYASDISTINNTIDHLQDTATNLDSFISYQTGSTQAKIDDIENDILGINANQTATDAKISGLNTAINTTNTKINTLTTTVSNISSLQIVPSLTTVQRTLGDGSIVIDGGTINLAIRSTQTVDSRVVAFKVEFSPNEELQPIATTLDDALQSLYTIDPITLRPGGSSGVPVGPDHVSYNVYYKTDGYYLGSIVFTTQGTTITKDTTAKILAYTFNAVAGTSFSVTVTPIYECSSTTTNTLAPIW